MNKNHPNSKSDFNPSSNPFFEIGKLGKAVIVSTTTLVIIGILFAILPPKINSFKPDWFQSGSYETNIFLTISSSLLASGFLTITLTLVDIKQRREDINRAIKEIESYTQISIKRIQDTTTDNLLEELVGDKVVFEEISNHVIRQDFIRSNYVIKINFQWHEQDKHGYNYLKKIMIMKYMINNVSNQTAKYPLTVIEEKENDDIFPRSTKINRIRYQIEGENEQILEGENLQNNPSNNLQQYVEFRKILDIPPKASVECEILTESIVDSKLKYPIISLYNSKDLEIDIVDHPESLHFEIRAFHPNHQKLKTETNARCCKRWKIIGILPGQGVQIEWKPIKNLLPTTTSQTDYPKPPTN